MTEGYLIIHPKAQLERYGTTRDQVMLRLIDGKTHMVYRLPNMGPDHLGELLAVMHADGGHYVMEHGIEKAVKDAMAKYYKMSLRISELTNALDELVQQLPHIPESHCTCHSHPPCSDCVEWSGLRNAAVEARVLLKLPPT